MSYACYATVGELLPDYCLKEASWWFAEDRSLITSVCVTNFVHTAWSPDVLVKAEHCFGSRPIIILVSLVQLCLHWSCGMFFSEQGQVQLPPLEPISTEVRGHGYNSSAKGRISYSETAATSIWSILHRSIFERLLKT